MRLARFLSPCAALTLLLRAAPSHAQFFNGVSSRDGIDVIAVADSGALYRSMNGGVSWTRTLLGNKPLRDATAWDWNVVVVGDSGKVWRSTNLGGSWALDVIPGAPGLKRIETLGGGTLIVVGSGGTVLQSADGGATWNPQASGTSERLNSVRFTDAQNGWIAGANGFLARTYDGGANWTPVPLATANELNCVDAKGSAVWAVGNDATVFRSQDGGTNWTQLDLHADARPDVRAVWLQAADTVFITGGGGFIRKSVNAGSTWSFKRHTLQGQISDLQFVGPNGWAASSRVRAVMRTNNGGDTWDQPAGALTTRAWVSKRFVSSTIKGNTFAINPFNKNTFYCAMGNLVWISRDEGENWTIASGIPNSPPGGGTQTTKTNAFVVSAKDSNTWVAAVGLPDRIVWTEDAGENWTDALKKDFGEWGVPLEVDPDHPDTMFFGPESINPPVIYSPLFRSVDRGKTWAPYSDTLFRSPCDILVVPESDSAVIIVGDGVTNNGVGKYWRSTGNTGHFTDQLTVQSNEIPELACSRLRNSVTFGTNWSSGGVQRSSNNGLTWPNVHNAGQSWGVDIARDDPDCVVFGVYSGSKGYLSFSGGDGSSYIEIPSLPGSNYSFLARDRATILALQTAGIWKLAVTQTMPLAAQTVTVTAPNGGEVWQPGSVHDITWSAANVALARIRYRRSAADPWQAVGEAEGYKGRYTWTVPYDATSSAQIEVSDSWDASPADNSDAGFTIPLALIAETPASLGFGTHAIGSGALGVVTVTNPGTAPLVLSAITTGTGSFHAGRTALTLAPGAADTVGVTFEPSASVSYTDVLTLESNGYNAPTWQVPLYGSGTDSMSLELVSPRGGEEWRYGTAQKIEWGSARVGAVDLAYCQQAGDPWTVIADNVPDGAKSFVWVIPNAASEACVVRVREHGGGMEDTSKEPFRITVPGFTGPAAVDVGVTSVGVVRQGELRIGNGGTAPLTVSGVSSSDEQFWAGATNVVVAPGATEAVEVYYQPAGVGEHSAMLTVVSDDPGSPHAVPVAGRSLLNVGVEGRVPTEFGLWPNRPNPFTGRTVIRYALPVAAAVRLEVYNVKGEKVATLVAREQGAGEYSVNFGPGSGTGGTLPTGIYFYRFRAGAYTATHRMVMMK